MVRVAKNGSFCFENGVEHMTLYTEASTQESHPNEIRSRAGVIENQVQKGNGRNSITLDDVPPF